MQVLSHSRIFRLVHNGGIDLLSDGQAFFVFSKKRNSSVVSKPLSYYCARWPPQTLATNHQYYRAVFGINIFAFFCKKTLKFWIYPTTSCFIEIVQKIDFTPCNPILCVFLINHKVVPLVFFRFLWKFWQSRFRY